MLEKLKQGVMGNRGTAIILSLIIVTVLFILTSFLIRKVVTNTMMVRKATEEQNSHTLAKQGILYAADELNTSDGYGPNYDSTDWPGPGNRSWIELDLDNNDGDSDVTTGDKECRVRVDKNDLPPDVFASPDPNDDSTYITIESEDLPKKSVTLQAVAKNSTPLLKYVRFVNSDTLFDDETFGGSTNSLVQGDAPLCILGNVTWESGSTNDLKLGTDDKAIIYGTISDGGVSSLKISGAYPHGGYYYFFNPDDAPYDDPTLFDTAEGHYFSSAHLPSCYDYSGGGTPSFYYGGTQITFWPQIKENKYRNLASGVNCYLNNPDEINEETEWSDPSNDNDPSYDNDTNNEWFNDGEGSAYPTVVTTSYHYYPYAPRLVFNNIDTDASGSQDLSQYLSDETLNIIDYSYITNGIIFAEGDVSLSGIIPSGTNLTVVSGGNIFIDSNLLKEANTASLALLTKQDIVLNPTLRYGTASANTSSNPSWDNPDNCLGDPDTDYTSPASGSTSFAGGETKTYTLDIDLGKLVTGGRIALWNYQDGDGGQLETDLQVLVTRDDPPPATSSSWDLEVLPFSDVDPKPEPYYNIDFIPRTFRWIRLNLRAKNTHPESRNFDLSQERLHAVEIVFYGMDAALCADQGSLEVVTGGGIDQTNTTLPNNNAYQPYAASLKAPSDGGSFPQRLFFWGTLAEEQWTGEISGWNYISYVYDSSLSSYPPPSLLPSVNLVSLKRKGEI